MSLAGLRRLGFAAWLVAIALIANAAAQNQLALNVVEATNERAAAPATPVDPHAHHDHAQHVAAMQAPAQASHQHRAGPGGHTHKGHADCAVCGAVAIMAGLTLPAAIIFDLPRNFARPADPARAEIIRTAARYARYLSRAPPALI